MRTMLQQTHASKERKRHYIQTPILPLSPVSHRKQISSRPEVPERDEGRNRPQCCNPWQSCHRSSAFLRMNIHVHHWAQRRSMVAHGTGGCEIVDVYSN